jgi:hypothetical protein
MHTVLMTPLRADGTSFTSNLLCEQPATGPPSPGHLHRPLPLQPARMSTLQRLPLQKQLHVSSSGASKHARNNHSCLDLSCGYL